MHADCQRQPELLWQVSLAFSMQAVARVHRISGELRNRIKWQVHLGIPARDILQQDRARLVDKYAAQHGIVQHEEALAALVEGEGSRDWLLSSKDIANIRMLAEREEWRFADNDQLSVRFWCQQNPGKVLYFHEQAPMEGTRDYYHYHAADAAAAAAVLGRAGKQQAGQGSLNRTGDEENAADEDGAAGQQGGSAEQLEPALAGADDDLDRPERIDLRRETSAAPALPELVDWVPGFQVNPYNWTSFSIAIMLPLGVAAAKRWGPQCPLQMDSTFGCNKQKFPLFTLLAMDEHKQAHRLPDMQPGEGGAHPGCRGRLRAQRTPTPVPIGFLICSQERVKLIQECLEAVTKRVSPTACTVHGASAKPTTPESGWPATMHRSV